MNTTNQSMTYAGSGVDYSAMDPFKRACQEAATITSSQLEKYGFEELEWSRGESVYLVRTPTGQIISHVEEGLGTKNLIADAVALLTGKSYYHFCAQDTVAMIVNDMITLGAMPISVAMHLAVGTSDWFDDKARTEALIRGWRESCEMAGCAWGGGETPTLKGVVVPGASLLSGSAVGFNEDEADLFFSEDIQDGDAIVFIESSGVHANGLTLARKIADALPNGYATLLPDGTMYGETLLTPTHIYVKMMRDLVNDGMPINYAVNITGHGWRKLMRANGLFEYVIDTLPRQQPIFDFINKHGPDDDVEMYGNYNMGAGFAIFIKEKGVAEVITAAADHGFVEFKAGKIRASDRKRVVIKPKGITFESDTLAVR